MLASDAVNPYVGLRPFEREDSLYFFGRREQTGELLERLHQTRFLGVVGSSGGGKSSLIRAGVIPALLGGFLVESRDRWQIATLKPGNAPLRNLAAALCEAFEEAPDAAAIATLQNAITEKHVAAVREYLTERLNPATNLLVLIDQFEEIFSFRGVENEDHAVNLTIEQRRARARCRAESADFVNLMLELSSKLELPVYTILTMRTDFLGDCDVFYGLPEAMNRSQYLVPRLSRSQLRDAIMGPAMLSRTELSPRLLDEVLNAFGDRSDQLPVLQHAMLRTWDIWQAQQTDAPIDLEHYQRAGKLDASLKQDANKALDCVDPDITAQIFKCLTDTDRSHRRVRRPSQLSELAAVSGTTPETVRGILEVFCQDHRNFVVFSSTEEYDDPRVDISHESLIRQWDSLRDWVDEERESRDKFIELVERGHSFSDGRKTAPLQDPDLQIALDWRSKFDPSQRWAKRYSKQEDDFKIAMDYLDQSHNEAEAKRFSVKLRIWGLRLVTAVVVIVALTLSIGYMIVRDELRGIEAGYDLPKFEKSDVSVAQKLVSLTRLRQLILELDAAQQGWWIPWDRVFDSLPQRFKYIALYNTRLQQQVLQPLDKRITALANSNLGNEDRAYLISGIVRRILLISARLEQDPGNFDALAKIPGKYLRVFDPDISIESSLSFDLLYKNYLQLFNSNVELEEERLRLRATLETVIIDSHGDYEWLVSFAELQGFPEVEVGDFWSGSRQLSDPSRVSSAYTLTGMEFIEKFLDELRLAGQDSVILREVRSDFMANYQRNYLKAWETFAKNFDDGKNKLRGRDEWVKAMESMATPNNPYFSVLRRIQREIEAVSSEGIFKSRDAIDYFAEIQDFVGDSTLYPDSTAKVKAVRKAALKLVGKMGKAGKVGIKLKGAKKSKKTLKILAGKDQGQLEEQLELAARAYLAYRKGLKNLAVNVDSINMSYAETWNAFSSPDDLSTGDGAGSQSWAAVSDMQRILGKPRESTRIFWKLFTGPLRLAYQYMQEEAACYLQNSWEDGVTAELKGVSRHKVGDTLLGKGGLLWDYIGNEAEPFLSKKYRQGYTPATVNGKALAWTSEFLKFLNDASAGRGLVGGEFNVKITALPTGINQGAKISPYATYLNVHCADGVQSLANYHYGNTSEFFWSLESCGDVTLQIEVEGYSLRKQYPGPKGFAKFLADFRDGRRIFTIEEFPQYASALHNEKVQAIDVNYEIRGHEPVIRMLTDVPLAPPTSAVACWTR